MAAAKKRGAKRKAASESVASAKDFLKGLQATEGGEAFRFFSDNDFATVTERVPTGVLAFDRLTGGGWPVGRFVELAAWEGVGKSTLLDQSIAQAQRAGMTAALIDTEGARDMVYMERLGVDLDQLIRIQANTIEDCFTAIDRCIDQQETLATSKTVKPLFIVWDSIGGTPTKAEAQGAADDAHMMVAARNIKMNLRRIHNRLSPARVALVATNHFYRSIGPFATLKTYGGSGIPYFASLRVWLTNKGQIKIGSDVVGHQVEAKIKKSRLGSIKPPVIAGILHGSGFDNSFSLFEWGMENGDGDDHKYVSRRGAWCHFHEPGQEPVTFQRGFVGFGELLSERPDLYQTLATRYLDV